jgi:membrane protein
MTWKYFYELVRDTYYAWEADKAPRLGAALAYYMVFSLAPLLIIAIGIAGSIFGQQAARGEIVGQLRDTVGEPMAQAIEGMIKDTSTNGTSSAATLLGVGILIFGATGAFVQLQDALNTIWKVTPKPRRAIVAILRDRALSFLVVLGAGFLLLASLILSAGLSAIGKYVNSMNLPGGTIFWQGVHALVSFLLITLLFAMIFKILPDAKIAWRDVWLGSVVTALLFTVGKYLIGLYLGRTSVASAFGAAGSVVLILVWVYYSSQILLFGAEFTRVYALNSGSPARPAENAVAVTPEARAEQGMPAGDYSRSASVHATH